MKQVLERVSALVKKDSAQTAALLNSCKSLTIKDDVMTLGFATEVLKGKMEMGDNLELTRRAVSQVLGSNLEIVCTVVSSKTKAAPPGDGGRRRWNGRHCPQPGWADC